MKNLIVDDQEIIVSMQNHIMGYNLIVKSPFTNKILVIREDGKFISK